MIVNFRFIYHCGFVFIGLGCFLGCGDSTQKEETNNTTEKIVSICVDYKLSEQDYLSNPKLKYDPNRNCTIRELNLENDRYKVSSVRDAALNMTLYTNESYVGDRKTYSVRLSKKPESKHFFPVCGSKYPYEFTNEVAYSTADVLSKIEKKLPNEQLIMKINDQRIWREICSEKMVVTWYSNSLRNEYFSCLLYEDSGEVAFCSSYLTFEDRIVVEITTGGDTVTDLIMNTDSFIKEFDFILNN